MEKEEQKIIDKLEDNNLQEQHHISDPIEQLQKSLSGLNKYGGFQLLKGMLKSAELMDPNKKAMKNIFLSDPAYSDTRQQLAKEISLWLDILKAGKNNPMEIIASCQANKEKANHNISTNLKKIHEEIKALEVTYRGLDSFFANASQSDVNCITLMNVNREDLSNNNSDDTICVRDEISQYYDVLSLKENYSLLVIPGYLGEAKNVRMWAQTAHKNKVILVTDFKDSQNFEMLNTELNAAKLQGTDDYLGNVIMTANYILGRKKSEFGNKEVEEDDLYIPASSALAGRMTNTEDICIAQPAAGKKFGTFDGINGVRMKLRKSEITELIDKGIIPIVESDGRTMAFSNHTLYNGATLGQKEYSIVRVYDWIGKVLMNYCNDEAYTIWTPDKKRQIKADMNDFLSDYKGVGGIFENYDGLTINQDPKTKDIHIDVRITPFYAAQNFLIKLTGKNNGTDTDWDQKIE